MRYRGLGDAGSFHGAPEARWKVWSTTRCRRTTALCGSADGVARGNTQRDAHEEPARGYLRPSARGTSTQSCPLARPIAHNACDRANCSRSGRPDPKDPVAVLWANDLFTLEPDLRRSHRANQSWRQRSLARADRRPRQVRGRTAASDRCELALPTPNRRSRCAARVTAEHRS